MDQDARAHDRSAVPHDESTDELTPSLPLTLPAREPFAMLGPEALEKAGIRASDFQWKLALQMPMRARVGHCFGRRVFPFANSSTLTLLLLLTVLTVDGHHFSAVDHSHTHFYTLREMEDPKSPAYHALEKRVVRKLDRNVVPMVCVLFLLSFLDRSNIGNARTAGMVKDLHFDANGKGPHTYDWLLTIFYISYILFEFLIMGWKVVPPHIWAAGVVFSW